VILVAGGTGTTGTHLVRLLRARGENVRVLTRKPSRASHLEGVEVVVGDVRDADVVRRAATGVGTVVSLVQGFAGPGEISLESIDRDGNRNLFNAASEAGVEHGILASIAWAAPDSRMDLAQMKFAAEEHLKSTGMAWTILRPSCLMETWTNMIGEPLLKTGKTTVYGHGRRATNFVSALDLARFADLAVVDPALRGQTIQVGGPNMTFNQFVEEFAVAAGVEPKAAHLPLPVMRVMQYAMRPFNLVMARHVQMGVVIHTRDTSFDAGPTRSRFPGIPVTSLREVVAAELAVRDAPALAQGPRNLAENSAVAGAPRG
jgi:NADH dehydrogenase